MSYPEDGIPQSIPAERHLVAAAMANRDVLRLPWVQLVKPEHFYVPSLAVMFDAIETSFAESGDCSFTAVLAVLVRRELAPGFVSEDRLREVSHAEPNPDGVEASAQLVLETWRQREDLRRRLG